MTGPYRAEPVAIAPPSWWRRVLARLSCAFTGHAWARERIEDMVARCDDCGALARLDRLPYVEAQKLTRAAQHAWGPPRPVSAPSLPAPRTRPDGTRDHALAYETLDNAPLIEAVRDERRAAAQRRRM